MMKIIFRKPNAGVFRILLIIFFILIPFQSAYAFSFFEDHKSSFFRIGDKPIYPSISLSADLTFGSEQKDSDFGDEIEVISTDERFPRATTTVGIGGFTFGIDACIGTKKQD
jgi:hypothetical protein